MICYNLFTLAIKSNKRFMNMSFFLRKFFYLLLLILAINSNRVFSADINLCIKNAVQNGVDFNRILSLCRDNIKAINLYNNDYKKEEFNKNNSNFISTNKTDKIIHEMIKEGSLSEPRRSDLCSQLARKLGRCIFFQLPFWPSFMQILPQKPILKQLLLDMKMDFS